MGELAIGSNALQWSRGNHEFCSINLESADPDLLQVEHQGIELAKDPELLATLGGQGAFGQAVAHQQGPAARLSDRDNDAHSTGRHQLYQGGMGNGFHGGDSETRDSAAQDGR
mgnify:FL=1